MFPRVGELVMSNAHYIDGKRVKGDSDRFHNVFNPATGKVTAKVPLASLDEVKRAISVSKKAYPMWAGTPRKKGAGDV